MEVKSTNPAIVGHLTLSHDAGGNPPQPMVTFTPAAAQRPSIGRIVTYRPAAEGDQPVPAMIVRVWSDTCVNLRVFSDSAPGPDDHRRSVVLAENPDQRDRWSWPARV
jgi:hypothetical protein